MYTYRIYHIHDVYYVRTELLLHVGYGGLSMNRTVTEVYSTCTKDSPTKITFVYDKSGRGGGGGDLGYYAYFVFTPCHRQERRNIHVAGGAKFFQLSDNVFSSPRNVLKQSCKIA